MDFKIPAVKFIGPGRTRSMACAPGSWCLHVRPKLDSADRMFAIVVHLTMFASAKHSVGTVHFEAGHCKHQEPGAQAIDLVRP